MPIRRTSKVQEMSYLQFIEERKDVGTEYWNTANFPGCCAGIIFFNPTARTKDQILESLEYFHRGYEGDSGFAIATAIEHTPLYDALCKDGWVCVSSCANPNSGNVVHIFIYTYYDADHEFDYEFDLDDPYI